MKGPYKSLYEDCMESHALPFIISEDILISRSMYFVLLVMWVSFELESHHCKVIFGKDAATIERRNWKQNVKGRDRSDGIERIQIGKEACIL